MGNNSKKSSDTGASRQERKAKKRKLEDAIPDVPGEENGDEIDVDNEDGGVKIDEGREAKRAKKDKKAKTEDVDPEAGDENGTTTATGSSEVVKDILGEEQGPRKSKKERKAERKAALAKEKAAGTTTAAADPESVTKVEQVVNGKKGDAEVGSEQKPAMAQKTNGTSTQSKTQKNNQRRDQKRADKRAAAGGEDKDDRFIVFVGNLPFTATTASITKHFAAVKPKSVRHLTQRDDPSKSRGCAFVEFDGYDHMKTALRLFHHSNFEDGLSPPRKINVELTAGGGGNTKDRRSKIQQKNAKLNDERSRRIQEEEKAKWEKKKEAGDDSGIHPSRRGRVPGGR